MNQSEIYACAPSYSNESVFFNLILNTNYENTKENCVIFFKNYSKNIIISKRDLFRNIINELTLSQISNKGVNDNSNESIYLIRTCIKKYSRNNIINALYDFICQNEDDNVNNKEIPIINSLSTTNDHSSIEKIVDVDVDVENKEEIKDKDKKEKNQEENIINQGIINNNNNSKNKKKKNGNLLKKKRKHDVRNENEYIPNTEKKRKNSTNEDKTCAEVNNVVNNNNIDSNINTNPNVTYDNNKITIKKEIILEENDENNVNNESLKIKQEKDDFFKKSFVFDEKEKEEYKIKLRQRNKSLNNKNPNFINALPDNINKKNSYSAGKKIRKKNNIKKINEKNIRSHLIKINGIVVSYNMDKSEKNCDNNNIVFLCNNNLCKGKGIYLTDKNIFKETEKHNFKKYTHVIAHKNKNLRDELLKDKNCDGYQILKNDRKIKDKKVIYLK